MLTPPLPLVLDLDGTLIHTDTFHEMMVHLLIHKPWMLLVLPFWFLKGRAFAKAQLVEHTDLCPAHLPYNQQLLGFVQKELDKGRPLVLATGSDHHIAQKVADHLGFFQEVIASDGKVNMTGPHKCQALLKRYGPQGFDYAGDSAIDTHVWQAARMAFVVSPKRGVLEKANAIREKPHVHHFPRDKSRFLSLLSAFRAPFWILCFTPFSWPLFISLSLISSGLFITNDLLTLYQDRALMRRKSIFAEGALHLSTALMLSPLLLLLGISISTFTLPYSLIFLTLYVPLFCLLDRVSRSLHPLLRWGLLGVFQLATIQGLHFFLN